MKIRNILFAVGVMLASPLAGRAQVIYTDNFNSDTPGYTTPVGWQFTGYGSYFPPYVAGDYSYIGSGTGTNGTGLAYVPISGVEGAGAVFLVSEGDLETNPNTSSPIPGVDNPDLINGNVGATFKANTTYTLTYLIASQLYVTSYNPYTTPPTGTQNVSLTDAGSVISASTQTMVTDSQGAFIPGQTVTFDTATDPSVVGDAIGIDANWINTSTLNKEVGFDNFVLTATADSAGAVPEPSTYVLFAVGTLVLALHLRRKSRIS